MNRIVISVIGRDCPGVVYAITSALAKEKCNVEQLSQTILKGQFHPLSSSLLPKA